MYSRACATRYRFLFDYRPSVGFFLAQVDGSIIGFAFGSVCRSFICARARLKNCVNTLAFVGVFTKADKVDPPR